MPDRSLNLTVANEIIAKALEKARAAKMQPLSVVIIDLQGEVKAMQREDGAGMYRTEIARGKAWGCAANKMPSRGLADRARQNPNFMLSLSPTAGGKFLLEPGGVLIKDVNGMILGAAGASGGSAAEDEAICIYGIRCAGLVPDPDR